jgi:hypothetical protein
MWLEAGNRAHLLMQGYHAKPLKLSLSLGGFQEKACTGVEQGRRGELLLQNRHSKFTGGNELLESINQATGRGCPQTLSRSSLLTT